MRATENQKTLKSTACAIGPVHRAFFRSGERARARVRAPRTIWVFRPWPESAVRAGKRVQVSRSGLQAGRAD